MNVTLYKTQTVGFDAPNVAVRQFAAGSGNIPIEPSQEYHIGIIREMNPIAARKEIGRQMALISELLGIKADKMPTNAARSAMTMHVVQSFPGWHVHEFFLAFDLALREKIPADLNHYQSFDLLFVRSVLNEYAKFRENALRANQPAQIGRGKIEELLADYRFQIQNNRAALSAAIISAWGVVTEGGELANVDFFPPVTGFLSVLKDYDPLVADCSTPAGWEPYYNRAREICRTREQPGGRTIRDLMNRSVEISTVKVQELGAQLVFGAWIAAKKKEFETAAELIESLENRFCYIGLGPAKKFVTNPEYLKWKNSLESTPA